MKDSHWWFGISALAVLVALASACGRDVRRPQTAAATLECARTALGGAPALDRVSSLVVSTAWTPAPGQVTGQPSTTQIAFRLPGGFKTVNRLDLPGLPAVVVRGMSADTTFAGGGIGDDVQPLELDQESILAIRHESARLLWMWLLRESPDVPVTLSLLSDSDPWLGLRATGPEPYAVDLFLDAATCLPVAATWERPPNLGDGFRAMAEGVTEDPLAQHVQRIEFADYEMFGALRLPTVMAWSLDGVPSGDWTVTDVQVNSDLADDFLSAVP